MKNAIRRFFGCITSKIQSHPAIGACAFILMIIGFTTYFVLNPSSQLPTLQSQGMEAVNSYSYRYNEQTKNPTLIRQDVYLGIDEKVEIGSPKVDPQLFKNFLPTLSDYEDSGYVAEPLYLPLNKAYRDYYITMCSPQLPEFQKYWHHVNEYSRQLLRKPRKDQQSLLHRRGVFSGSLFLPKNQSNQVCYTTIGQTRIAVPTHFFRVIYPLGSKKSAKTYLLPNRPIPVDTPMESFEISVTELEKMIGTRLPDFLSSGAVPGR